MLHLIKPAHLSTEVSPPGFTPMKRRTSTAQADDSLSIIQLGPEARLLRCCLPQEPFKIKVPEPGGIDENINIYVVKWNIVVFRYTYFGNLFIITRVLNTSCDLCFVCVVGFTLKVKHLALNAAPRII